MDQLLLGIISTEESFGAKPVSHVEFDSFDSALRPFPHLLSVGMPDAAELLTFFFRYPQNTAGVFETERSSNFCGVHVSR